MRCDQHIGLKKEAREWLEKNCQMEKELCPHCKGFLSQSLKSKTYAHYSGMFSDKYPLDEYVTHHGITMREIVQASPWSSGPVFFICLEDEYGNLKFQWSEKEIDDA